LQRQQAHLWAIAMGDHELVLFSQWRQCSRRRLHILSLYLGGHRLATLEQRIAS